MNVHSRARTTPFSRERIARRMEEAAWSEDQAAALGISERTAYKWLARYRAEGCLGLLDRSSRPHVMPGLTPLARQELILELRRRCRMSGPQIARKLRMPRSTVAAVLKRGGIPRLRDLEPTQAIRRYEWERPGDLIHLDIKKLGRIAGVGHRITGNRRDRTRGAGWEYVHVAIDDASRLCYVEVLANELAETTVGFLKRALIFFARHAVKVRRIMTDNGSCYVSHLFAELCQNRALRHIRTRPYTPRTNGKAERLIQTLLREWAYVRPYSSSARRTQRLASWLRYYNHSRPHGSLNGKPPISRV